MNKKKALALLLALVFMLISALPSAAFAEEAPPLLPPEDGPAPEGPPVSPNEPAEPDAADTAEPGTPEIPPDEDYAEAPGDVDLSAVDVLDDSSSDEDGEAPADGVPVEGEEDGNEADELFINVLVPASGQVIVNPYHISIDTGTGETTDQIVHEPQVLESFTEYPVQVSVQVLGSLWPWSAARFVSAPPAHDALDKEIFMYVEFQSEPTQWSYTYGGWSNQILVMDWWEEKENVLTLDAYSVGYFRLFGAMTPYPADMWTEDDVMTVTLAFTFAPVDESASFFDETPDESFDPMFSNSPGVGFDDMQAVIPEPLPDTIPEPVHDQNPEATAEGALEFEPDETDIFDLYENIAPVLNSDE